MRADPGLYPELAAAGSLTDALAQAATRAGSTVEFHHPTNRERLICASVRNPRGVLSVNIGAIERWFIVSIWSRGVQLTMGKTKALDAVVAAAWAWTSGASLGDLHALCPFLEITDLALAHEQAPRRRWPSSGSSSAPGGRLTRASVAQRMSSRRRTRNRCFVSCSPIAVTHPYASAPVPGCPTAKAFRASTWTGTAT